jgi:outer membrane lipoprotein-sorting protein
MTSGISHRRPHFAHASALLCVILSLSGAAGAANDWTVEALMGLVRDRRQVSVPFEEATYSSLLSEPVTVRGLLKFVPPDRLEKIVTAPDRERYVVDGDRVTFESERKGVTRTVSLEDYPALRSFVEAFRSTLTGDAAQLRNVYEVTLGGARGKWTLLLRPRETSGRTVVDYILLSGSEGQVETIAIRSPDGDRSVMTLRSRPAP